MQVYFGTVVRGAPVRKAGELVSLDWQRKKILAKVPIFPTNPSLDSDPNPRGNARGCKGIEILGDRVIAANYHTLKVYDKQLRHQRDISHSLMADLHEIVSEGNEKIWVTSTYVDAALEYDLESGELKNEFWPREIPQFQKLLNLTPLEFDKTADQRSKTLEVNNNKSPSHLHLTAIVKWQEQILALCSRFGVIVNLSSGEILIKDRALTWGHNLLLMDEDIVIVNDTFGRTIRFYDLSTRKRVQVINLTQFSWVRNLEKIAKAQNFIKHRLNRLGLSSFDLGQPLFVRGLDRVGDMLLVGISPASILQINWRKKELVDAYCYSRNVQVCIHGLKALVE